MKHSIFVLLLTLLFTSCDNSEKYNKIYGEWKCAQWIVPSTGEDLCKRNEVSFNFKENQTYTYQYGSLKENGVYKISGETMYSKPEYKLEIGVEINKLTNDSLEFIMSRSGEKEILTLLKQ